jgi:cytochrome P450
MEPVIRAKIDKLVEKLREAHRNGETLIGVQVFGALTTDVISHYAYGESFGELDKPGFPSPLTRDIKSLLISCHFRRFLPWVANGMQRLPQSWLMWLNPAVGSFFDLERKMARLSMNALEQKRSRPDVTQERTVFDALINPEVPLEEQSLDRLREESFLILGAGLDTNSRVLTAIVCYLITYPRILAKLRTELQPLWDSHGAEPSWTQLESVPYLVSWHAVSSRPTLMHV